MRILEGIVTNLSDETKSGQFNAKVKGQDLSVPVIYTSPYFNIHFQGVFAPPALHTEVLLLHDQDTNNYYYLSTILRQPVLAGSVPLHTPTTHYP